jgi:hypothetical protein
VKKLSSKFESSLEKKINEKNIKNSEWDGRKGWGA